MELTNELLYSVAPYAATLGIRIEAATAERVELRLDHRTELETLGGGMHGGALMSLCDVAAAVCGATSAGEGEVTTTAESTTYFLRPLTGSVAVAVGRPVKVGKALICVEVDVYDDSERHCVRTTQTLAVRSA